MARPLRNLGPTLVDCGRAPGSPFNFGCVAAPAALWAALIASWWAWGWWGPLGTMVVASALIWLFFRDRSRA